MAIALLLPIILAAQPLTLERATPLEPPCGDLAALLADAEGGLWATCGPALADGEEASELLYRAGEGWRRLYDVPGGARFVPADGGLLVLRRGDELYTLRRGVRGRAEEVTLAVMPPGSKVERVSRVRDGRLYVQTDSGVWRCAGDDCTAVTFGHASIAGVTERGPLLVDGDGVCYFAGSKAFPVGRVPSGPVATATSYAARLGAFAIADTVYAFAADAGGGRFVRLPCPSPPTGLAVVGSHLLAFASGAPVLTIDLADPESQAFRRLRDERSAPTPQDVYASASAAWCATSGRVLASTPAGLMAVSQPSVSYVQVAPRGAYGLRLAPLSERGLAVTSSAGVRLSRAIPGRRDLDTTLARERHLMRYSLPTAFLESSRGLIAGTSDGRLLRLGVDDMPTRELADLRGRGAYVRGLREHEGVVWGVLDIEPAPTGGIFGYDLVRGSTRFFGGEDGLHARATALALDARGTLLAATAAGPSPLLRYDTANETWEPLGTLQAEARIQLIGEIHDLAADDTGAVFLACAQGLVRWTHRGGYEPVDLPPELRRAPVLSVRAERGGVWFATERHGLHFWRDGQLVSFPYDEQLEVATPARGCLVDRPGGGVYLPLGVSLMSADHASFGGASGGLVCRLSTTASRAGTFLGGGLSEAAVFSGDSVELGYELAGYATEELDAYVTVDGEIATVDAGPPGTLRFAAGEPGRRSLSLHVSPRGAPQLAQTRRYRLRVRAPWYTTGVGVWIIVLLIGTGTGLLAYAFALRQRAVANHLERVVARRTADLHVARAQAVQASETKSMFLANMSHELRTPLNGLLGLSQVLQDTELDERQREYVGAIRRAGMGLSGIVGDVLAFAEIADGRVVAQPSECELAELLAGVREAYARRATEKSLMFTHDIRVPERATVDGAKLRSVVAHLVGNAIKFTESGFVHLAVEVVATKDPRFHHLGLRVSDSGVGIDEEQVARMFEGFHQADNTATRRFGGTGLGLAIVRTYVEALAGVLAVQPRAGGGSVFTVTVPLTEVSAVPEPPRPGAAALPVGVLADCDRAYEQLARDLVATGASPRHYRELSPAKLPQRLLVAVTPATNLVALRDSLGFRLYARSKRPLAMVACAHAPAARDLVASAPVLRYPLDYAGLRRLVGEWSEEPKRERKRPPTGSIDAKPVLAKAPESASPFCDLAADYPLRILVAEDNAMNRMLVLTVLKKLGYRPTCVEHGGLAVEAFAAKPYDLILMDVHMPEMDGLEATREIRRRFPELGVTISALTANASEEGERECREAGMDAFLTKPLDVARLKEVLRGVTPLTQAAPAVRIPGPAVHPPVRV